MFTMLLGLLIVGVSAAAFGFALFGHRPVPQTATAATGSARRSASSEGALTARGGVAQAGQSAVVTAGDTAESTGESIGAATAVAPAGGSDLAAGGSDLADSPAEEVVPAEHVLRASWVRRTLQREPTADHQPSVRFTAWLRIRSALALVLVAAGMGAILGVVLTVIIVGAVFVLT